VLQIKHDKVLIKFIEDVEKFLKKIAKTKEFWSREVLLFFEIPPDQIQKYLKIRE
jgi:hypothetical protein